MRGCFFIGLLVLGACGGSPADPSEGGSDEEAIPVDSATADSLNKATAVLEYVPEPPAFQPNGGVEGVEGFLGHIEAVYDTLPIQKGILPERFGASFQLSYTLRRKSAIPLTDSTAVVPQCHVWHFEYKDTNARQNVLRNWFLEFGEDRKEIKRTDHGIAINSVPMHIVIGETSLSVLELGCEDYGFFTWDTLSKGFLNALKKPAAEHMEVNCNQTLIWR